MNAEDSGARPGRAASGEGSGVNRGKTAKSEARSGLTARSASGGAAKDDGAGSTPAKTTRPAGASGSVSCGSIDELLDETPEFPEHRRGRLGGMDKGKKIRWGLAGLACLVILGIWGAMRAVQADVAAHRFDVPFPAKVPQGEDAVMHWHAGHARLGLHRDGVRKIMLPDAEILLAPDQVHAQVWVEVANGQVVRIKELVGQVKIVRGAQGLAPSAGPGAVGK